jgi:PAS domain S-box-containing protein
MPVGDVTILDQSCHSFLLLIVLALSFFSYYYPNEENMPLGLKVFLILPTIIILGLLWTGELISASHAHQTRFEVHYKEYYVIYLIWYVILLFMSIYFLVNKIFDKELKEYKLLLLTILTGLIITNLAAFLFGLYLPWIMGFYYLVEISPLAFFVGVIITSTIAITKFNLFPAAVSKIQTFSLNKKIFFAAVIVVPVVILLLQIPLGRVIFGIETAMEWERYFIVSLAGGIIVSIAMAFIISRIIATPINKLTERTNEISKGNYGIKVDISSNDELGILAGTFNNMSEVLKADSMELKSKQERIDLLLNAFEKSNAAICAFNPEGKILEINTQFIRLFGINREELIDNNIYLISDKKNELNELTEELKNFRNNSSYKEEITINSEEEKNYLINISPFSLKKDTTAGYFLIIVDITKIKKLEAELATNEKMAALGKFSAVLAHEIKTPLTSIKMNTDMLAESLPLNDEDKQSMNIINREITRLNKLVKEVLQYSRRVELKKGNVPLHELFEEIIIQTKIKFSKKNFRVINECSDTDIYGDREKLKQVFLNLIENAFQASGKDGHMLIRSERDESCIFLTFTDNGPGIEEDHKGKIFDPFYTTKNSGTGLGLAVAQKIIEQHNGTIELASSEPGKTVFRIVLNCS